MKRLLFSLIAIGLLSTSCNAQTLKKGSIIESKDQISCASFGNRAYLSGWLRNADCKNITKGVDLKIVKVKLFDSNYAGYTKGILVKLPTGMTTWIAR